MDSAKVLSHLQSQCSRREYCTREITAKALKALDGNETACSEVVAALVKEGYVSDRRYAEAFARDSSSLKGWGQLKITFALRGKGISEQDIRAALEQLDPERASSRLKGLIESRAKALQGDPQIKLKLLRYALGRGYSYDEVRPIVDEVLRHRQ